MPRQSQKNSTFQWGLVCGLLMFSFVTLSGICFRVDPFVIAQRALISAGAAFFVTFLAFRLVGLSAHKRRNTWQR